MGRGVGEGRQRSAPSGVQAGRWPDRRNEYDPGPRLARRLRPGLGPARHTRRRAPVRRSRRADEGGGSAPGCLAGTPSGQGARARGRLGEPARHRPLGRRAPGTRHVPAPGRRASRGHQVHRPAQGGARRTAGPPARPRSDRPYGARLRGPLQVPPQAGLRPVPARGRSGRLHRADRPGGRIHHPAAGSHTRLRCRERDHLPRVPAHGARDGDLRRGLRGAGS